MIFSDTVLKGKIIPYNIFKKGGLNIGVFGLELNYKDWSTQNFLRKHTLYRSGTTCKHHSTVVETRTKLSTVICLSHLGYKYNEKKISDEILAQQTSNIDLILGGHTHLPKMNPFNTKTQREKVLVAKLGMGWHNTIRSHRLLL